jgi:hypothetical protein
MSACRPCCVFDLPPINDFVAQVAPTPAPSLICRPCCIFDLPAVDDLSSRITIAPNQSYSFVVNCPPGYGCSNQTITDIPSLIVPRMTQIYGGTVTMQGCQGPINGTVPANASTDFLNSLAAQMFQQWAAQRAGCNAVIINQGVWNTMPTSMRTDVWNDPQCADGICPDGSVGSHVCIPAGTYSTTVTNPAPYVGPSQPILDKAKKEINAFAKAQAQSEANASKVCPSSNACGAAFNGATYVVDIYDPIGAPYTSASGSGNGASFTMSAACWGLPAYGKQVMLQFPGASHEIPYTPPVPGQDQICSLKLVVSTSGSFGGNLHIWLRNTSGVGKDIVDTGFTPGTTTICLQIPSDTAAIGFAAVAVGCRYPNPPSDYNGATGAITVNGTFGEGGSNCPVCVTSFAGPTWNLTNWFGTAGDPPHSTGGYSASGPNFHIFASSDGVAMATSVFAVDFGYNGADLSYDSKGVDLTCHLNVTTAQTNDLLGSGGNIQLVAVGPGGGLTILGLSGVPATGIYSFTIPAGTTSLKFAATCYAVNNTVASIDISGSFGT